MEHIGEFALTKSEPKRQQTIFPELHVTKWVCKQKDADFAISWRIEMNGYEKDKVYFPMAPICANGKSYEIARNKFLKNVKAWNKSAYLVFPKDTERKAKEIVLNNRALSLGEQAMHIYRMDNSKWRNKHAQTIKTDGKVYYRAELRKDTAYHYRNCGTPIPTEDMFPMDNYKWNKPFISDHKIGFVATCEPKGEKLLKEYD